jgi:hypothetical protein
MPSNTKKMFNSKKLIIEENNWSSENSMIFKKWKEKQEKNSKSNQVIEKGKVSSRITIIDMFKRMIDLDR